MARQSAATINKQLDRIEAAVLGNGHEGLLARTARIEEKLITSAQLAADAKEAAEIAAREARETVVRALDSSNALSLNVVSMNELLKAHLGTDHLSQLMKKKSFWVLIVIIFITLHLVSTYVPNLWDALMLYMGIPKLVIPIS